jgi:hypothetical protein
MNGEEMKVWMGAIIIYRVFFKIRYNLSRFTIKKGLMNLNYLWEQITGAS